MKRLIEINVLQTDSEKMKISKKVFNAICIIAAIFCIFTTVGYCFLLNSNEWIGLLITFCFGIMCLFIYVLVAVNKTIYNKHEMFFKKLVVILLTLWLFYESNLVGGFYYKSLEISFMIYIIIVPALLDTMFLSIGLFAGSLIIIYHAILYIYDIKITLDIMNYIGISPLETQDEIWLFFSLYISIYAAIRTFIVKNKKYLNIIEKQNKKNKNEIEIAKENIKYTHKEPPDDFFNKYKLNIYQRPYYEISGDFYYITKISQKYYIFFVDICGHGLEAAMFVIMLKNELYKLTDTNIKNVADNFTNSVSSFLENIDKGVTITIIELDPFTDNIKYINNGNYLFIYDDYDCRMLENNGFGLMRNYKVVQDNIKNKTLVLMSDGIIEGANDSGEQFEIYRTMNIIKNGGDIINNIMNSYNNYITSIQDDITILTIEVTK